MSAIAIALIVLACVCTGAVLGNLLRNLLPNDDLSPGSQEAVKLGLGFVGTMCALVLGLLISSAKASYDAVNSEMTQMSAKVIFLDRVLTLYGPETKDARDLLRITVIRTRDKLWPQDSGRRSEVGPASPAAETMLGMIHALSPKDDVQRSLRGQALSLAFGLSENRWLFYEQSASSVPTPMIVILVFWLTVIFVGFGLFAPRNATVIGSLFFAALSISGAIFLIMEMYTPFSGVMHVSSAPVRFAIAQLGR